MRPRDRSRFQPRLRSGPFRIPWCRPTLAAPEHPNIDTRARPARRTEAERLSATALARSSLPARLEERQRIFLLVGVFGDLLEIQVCPQSGRLRDFNVAVHHLHRVSDDMLLPRLI